jgi:hypothetical protein
MRWVLAVFAILFWSESGNATTFPIAAVGDTFTGTFTINPLVQPNPNFQPNVYTSSPGNEIGTMSVQIQSGGIDIFSTSVCP